MYTLRAPIVIALLTGPLSACAPAVVGELDSRPAPTQSSFNQLASADLAYYRNAYEAVRSLRASWLAGRSDSPDGPRVFVDGILTPGDDVLASIPSHRVLVIHYLSASEATSRYGGGSLGGAILVTTLR